MLNNNLAEKRFTGTYTVNPSGKLLDHLNVFNNPMMRSSIISYKLEEPSSVRIEFFLNKTKKIREMFMIPGNPGGRKGENKIFWDGTNLYGVKVPYGTYRVRLSINNDQFTEEFTITY